MNNEGNAKERKTGEKSKRIVSFAAVALAAALIVTGVFSIAVSGAKANYKQTREVRSVPVKITVDADLASGLAVLEHEATKDENGEYVLNLQKEVSSNSYDLMPGVDILKDPFVKVTGKTEIPAYLYIEVVDLPEGRAPTYSYQIDSGNWTLLKKSDNTTPVTGKNGGKVYVYNSGASFDKDDTNEGTLAVNILSGGKVTVSPDFDASGDYTNASLSFHAYMAQAVDGKSAYDIAKLSSFLDEN